MGYHMRCLYLVGMSLPSGNLDCLPAASLTSLVALDPRHGVFPNLVMTPLMATLFHLHQCNGANVVDEFLRQLPEILADESKRRFNVLKTPEKKSDGVHYTMDDYALEMLQKIDCQKDLWVVFGYWPISAILQHLVTGETKFSEKSLNDFNIKFLNHALDIAQSYGDLPKKTPKCITPRPGLFFRLFSDLKDTEMVRILDETLRKMSVEKQKMERIISVLHTLVPLPHNEAYDNRPYGRGQSCFMLGLDPKQVREANPPEEVFWRYIGRRIRDRLLD